MYNFGVGIISLIPPGANAQPVPLGTLQDIQLDLSYTDKELYGQNQFPVDVARAQAKLSGKAKFAHIRGSLFASVMTGATTSAGYTAGAINEAGTIPTTPFQVTVTHAAAWVADCAVYDLTAGILMTPVASGPATGQYSVAAGIYTFATADVGHNVLLNYSYTVPTVGQTTKLSNTLMGTGTQYTALAFNNFRASALGYKLYALTVPKLSLPMKNEDYTIMDLDFSCYADSQGRVIDVYTSE